MRHAFALIAIAAAAAPVIAAPIQHVRRNNVVVDLVNLDKRPLPGFDNHVSWDYAYSEAKKLLPLLSQENKSDIVTGVGWTNGFCVGNIREMPQIGFQGLCLQDGPVGMRFADLATTFSTPINLAATFDKALMFKQGLFKGKEQRGKGVQVTLGPGMNFLRAPEGGRSWESYGADPFLQSWAARLEILGIQSNGVIATAKHFILNDQEHNRQTGSDSQVGRRALYEVYLRPFIASVDAGVGAVMCSYNKVNGTLACHNPALYEILKGELGFKGFVMTDWWGGRDGIKTALAGVDMMMAGDSDLGSGFSLWGQNLTALVKNGSVPVERVDDMVTRVLATWIRMGQDDGTYPKVNFNSWNTSFQSSVNVQGRHKDHVRAVGAASSVLVKNTGSLPLSNATYKTIAVIGEDAFGPANGLNKCPDKGCVDGTVAQGWGSGTTVFPYIVAPVDGISDKAKPQNITILSTKDNAVAPSVAAKADIAIVFGFANSGEGYITIDGNEGDRNDLSLWHNGDALVKSVADVQKTIVVIHSPGPVLAPWVDHPNITAIIYAGMPGQETGNAIADVLFGDVNPSGRLPYTVGVQRSDYAVNVKYTELNLTYDEGILIDYRWFEAQNKTPAFAFGHGLSYTKFDYSKLNVEAPNADRKAYKVSVNVTNSGKVDGHEVVQLYLALPTWTCQSQGCAKELRDFERVHIKAGETATVSLHLYKEDLAFYDVVTSGWVVPKGDFVVSVGASSADIRQTETITL
ncbi:glycoside hydrolase family 3 protein [Gonapodya prolifera JEL478]|uniref:beta-glucosidase n=1 Tax=Gonapodya prolifera (strain JEL478) TaxID=1344416 RepID=A0A139A8I2_GONPJ|nr:glycoside hydrolase family 3 protein [Gonapodya prolifera JEL478]|eukprot:KXS13090.1 glycoside hydrolase family 3 protein [Gonapodya prolifera JEL478]